MDVVVVVARGTPYILYRVFLAQPSNIQSVSLSYDSCLVTGKAAHGARPRRRCWRVYALPRVGTLTIVSFA
jgi:hypothetical protein